MTTRPISKTSPRTTSTPTPWRTCDRDRTSRSEHRPDHADPGQPDLVAQGRLAARSSKRPPRPARRCSTRTQLHALGEKARAEYDRRRRDWHANLGPIKTPQLAELHEDLWDIVDSNAAGR